MVTHKEYIISAIADDLLLNGSLVTGSGLPVGKMGIAVFLFYYARYTNNNTIYNYAMDLLAKVLAEINTDTFADYNRGLAGIGFGIEHLSQNQFLQLDKSPLLMDLDRKVLVAISHERRMNLSYGLAGMGKYVLSRLNGHLLSGAVNHIEQLSKSLHFILTSLQQKIAEVEVDDLPGVLSFLIQALVQEKEREIAEEIISIVVERTVDDTTLLTPELYIQFLKPEVKTAAAIPELFGFRQEELLLSGMGMKEDKKTIAQELVFLLQCKAYLSGTTLYPSLYHIIEERIEARMNNMTPEWLEEYFRHNNTFSLTGIAGLGLALLGSELEGGNSWAEMFN